MKKNILYLFVLSGLIIGCDAFGKKETHKEISIEKKKVNDSVIRATVTTRFKTGDEVKEEIQILEGSAGDIDAQLAVYKKETLQLQGEQARKIDTEIKEVDQIKKIQLTLNPKSESQTNGRVQIAEQNGKVTLEAHINGLSAGSHAIHIHQKADCSSSDGKSTGGHWNPTFEPHGAWGAEAGFHRGDIGNFEADETGHGMITFTTDLWCLGCEDETKNILGKAIIVHQGEDDLTSQPSGAAGARISCAGIIE